MANPVGRFLNTLQKILTWLTGKSPKFFGIGETSSFMIVFVEFPLAM